jgi:translation initiation factor IF-3
MSMKEARALASERSLDLMEMWRKWDIAVVKLLDYWKFLYRQKKQDQKNKQKWKTPDLKTVRITFKIWEHDLQTRVKQVTKFWELWHPLKLTLMLRWRENHYGALAQEKMETFIWLIEEYYKIEAPIKRNWNTFIAMLKVKK